MKLSEQQAIAILQLKQTWQTLKIVAEEKDLDLQQLLNLQQKALTKIGIELLRRYQVAAENALPHGIPKQETVLKKQQFITEALVQLKKLHQSEGLKKIKKGTFQVFPKKRLPLLLQQLPLNTPLVQNFVHKLKEKVSSMKNWEDFKTILCILIAQYSLKNKLCCHYEKKEHWDYYQQTPAVLSRLQEDFMELSQQLAALANQFYTSLPPKSNYNE